MSLGDLLSLRGRLSDVGKRLQQRPQVDIREAPDGGEAKIVGALRYLRPGETLTAPLSHRPCACWEVSVEERAPGDATWYPLVRRHDACGFLLEDETGVALIHPKIWGLEVVKDVKNKTGLFSASPPPMEIIEFLSDNGFSTDGIWTERPIRYREGVLEEGEQVAVFGPCRWAPDPDQGSGQGSSSYRGAALRLELGGEVSGVTVSDDPRVMK